MSISGVIQITFLVWLLSCQYHSACGQRASAVGYSSLSFLVMCTGISLQVAHSRVVYVTPNTTTPCPKESANSSCHTLNWYSGNGSERLISDDTVVVLLKGTHSLKSTICIENHKNLTFIGEADYALLLAGSKDQTPHPMSWINCTSSNTGIVFLNSTDIHIMSLGFDSCGGNFALDSDNVSTALLFGLSYNVSIVRVIINNTYGYGVHMNCVFGNIWINNSIVARASKTRDGKHGGNARFWFGQKSNSYCEHQCSKKYANLVILRSSFIQGCEGSIGIEIIIECSQVYALMKNVKAVNNTGSNIALSLANFDYSAPSSIHIMNSIINGGRANTGGGMRFRSQLYSDRKHTNDSNNTDMYSLLTVSNTNFSFNSAEKRGGAVYISYQSMEYLHHIKSIMIKFINTSFVDNFGNGAVMECRKYLTFMDSPSIVLNVRLEGCHFHGNSVPNNKSGPIINMILTYIIIYNCSFMDNNGSVITLLKSNLNFHGDVSFVNNHADYGAAVKVCEASLVTLNNNTHIWFTNNTAIFKGGAVYSYQPCLDILQPCLFQPKLHKNPHTRKFRETLKLLLEFINNSAGIAGDAIYGGSLDSCFTITNYSYNRANSTAIMFPNYFDMTRQTGSSWVSSDLMGVCFCDVNEPLLHYHCRTEHPVVEVHPGEMFNVSMTTVGQMNGSTPGSIKAMFNDNDDFDRLIVYRDRNASSNKCENMTFILQSRQKYATILFEVATASPDNKMGSTSSSLNLQVLLKPCPIGFLLIEVDGGYSCACDPILLCTNYGCPRSLNMACNINRQEISFNPVTKIWFGCLEKSSSMSCELALSHQCHYCNAGSNLKVVNVFRLDDQCLPGRTGILCGACKPGFSYIIASNRIYDECKKCSNRNLIFLVPLFLLSGIALVVFLTVFNVTVTQGTLNGLILYSTAAYSYPSVFYTGQNEFPWLFISWLNLDLGFEICAYNGMTGYHYMWLNCAYTLYLLCIQIFIIYLSRKCVLFTRLIGKNVVSVLATVTVLSYSRMLYIGYYSLNYNSIYFSISNITSQPQRVHVPIFDGNITYLGLKHIPLFIIALIFSMFVFFFTFSLLLVQCLQKRSSIWCLRWVEKLRPFYEAFTGPCHDNYRFWPGFLLLMRIAFFLHFVQKTNRLGVAALCVLIMSLGGIFPRGIYKKWKLNMLEFLFLLNLSVTFIVVENYGMVYEYKGYSHHKYMAVYTSASFALFLLGCILLYHVYNRIKDTFIWKMLIKLFIVYTKKFQVIQLRRSRNNKCDEERAPLLPQPLPPVIKFPDFREPLLEN